ncbi:DUF917 domain-containing protein [Candidatus Microgenomates bacterium]|nr:DUF917 domain-containing protein [Candidatus Microgenomates bacterium]
MKLTKSDWITIAKGASLLSTGGGGDLLEARTTYAEVFKINKVVELKKLEELNQTDIVCTAYIAGSIGSFETTTKPLEKAFALLEKLLDKSIAGILPVEIGPGDIAETVKIASVYKIPVIDADFVGKRCSPEVFLETITLKNLSRAPLVITNLKGETKVIKKNLSAEKIEKIVRVFAKNSDSACFVVGYPLTVKEVRGVVGSRTLSLAYSLGKLLQKKNKKTLSAILKLTSGRVLFSGKISIVKSNDDKGFLTGTIKIAGTEKFISEKAEIFLKNESLIFWRNELVELSCPDLICVLNSKSLLGIYNRDLQKGEKVIVLGIPALPIWKTNKGLKLFSPKSFGYDIKPVLIK